MLYHEFLEGTGATDNEATYSIYKDVEVIYTENERMTKQEAYKLYKDPATLKKLLTEAKKKQGQKRYLQDRIELLRGDDEEQRFTAIQNIMARWSSGLITMREALELIKSETVPQHHMEERAMLSSILQSL